MLAATCSILRVRGDVVGNWATVTTKLGCVQSYFNCLNTVEDVRIATLGGFRNNPQTFSHC